MQQQHVAIDQPLLPALRRAAHPINRLENVIELFLLCVCVWMCVCVQIIWSKMLKKTVFARRYTMSIQLTDKAVVKWLNFVSVAQKS